MDTGYYFDNVLVGSEPAAAAAYRTSHWAPKLAAEVGHSCRHSCFDLGLRIPRTLVPMLTLCWSARTWPPRPRTAPATGCPSWRLWWALLWNLGFRAYLDHGHQLLL